MRRGHLGRNTDGAVAPLVGLLTFVLVAAAGVTFDYTRIASLDTELQNAADQAALAAVTQLDGDTGARARATAAASQLVSNLTFFGNDGNADGTGVTVVEVLFYTNKADAIADTDTTCPTGGQATSDADANFVCVRTNTRTANFALTPIVGALRGDASAKAVAGLDSAVCKVPPLMFCNPDETASVKTFNADFYKGVGLRVVTQGSPGGWAPGNYGYLNTNIPNGAPGLRQALGWENPPGNCSPQTGVDTKPGVTTTVTGALNTRFDIYDNSNDCPTGGTCGASINVRKDITRAANANGNNSCRFHNQGWRIPEANAYRPTTNTTLPGVYQMGHPRDICHYVPSGTAGSCWTNPFGTGTWDRDAYFRSNYQRADGTRWNQADWQNAVQNLGVASARLSTTTPTRYEVYLWEIANRDTVIDGVTILGQTPPTASGNTQVSHGKPVCSPTQGYSTGIIPSDTVADRRRLSVAVINCLQHSVNGSETNLPVIEWVDVFLVEPSLNRRDASNSKFTDQGDLYVEIIGETALAGGGTAGQTVRRDVPYLIE